MALGAQSRDGHQYSLTQDKSGYTCPTLTLAPIKMREKYIPSPANTKLLLWAEGDGSYNEESERGRQGLGNTELGVDNQGLILGRHNGDI